MKNVPEPLRPIMADLLLAVADDKLMLGHRNSDWTGLGPILEEDIAFSSIAQDEIAHSQALYELAGPLLGRTADGLAFGRSPEEYRCAEIVVRGDEFDWAVAIVRQLFCDHFDRVRLSRLARSAAPELAALANRLAAEEQVHVDHVDDWIRRLGRGTDEARGRLQNAITAVAPLAPMLFEPVDGEERLVEAGLYPKVAPPAGPEDADAFTTWHDAIRVVTQPVGLVFDVAPPAADARGGRRGHPSPDLAPLLDEMCEVFRTAPEAAW